MSLITVPNVFSAGAVIVASQHNSNFSVIFSDYNGNIDNTNIATNAAIAYSKLNLATSIVNADVNASAAIAYSKLNLTGSIVNADINASAAIVDSKLAQITTASKVSGAAVTLLTSLPSGAGVIPRANLPNIALSLTSATSFSTAATTGNISITNTKMYLVKVLFTASSSTPQPGIIFNGDTSTHYGYIYRGFSLGASASNANAASAASSILVGQGIAPSTASNGQLEFVIYPQATTSGKYVWVKGSYFGPVSGADAFSDFTGNWTNSADVTTFAVTTSGSYTGTVYLYEYALS